jgi:hypothetical protein
MKPVEFVLRRGWEKSGRVIEGMGLIWVYCIHIWGYHSETTLYNKYMLIKIREKED